MLYNRYVIKQSEVMSAYNPSSFDKVILILVKN